MHMYIEKQNDRGQATFGMLKGLSILDWDFESTRETVNPSWVSQLNQVHFITSLICTSKLVLAVPTPAWWLKMNGPHGQSSRETVYRPACYAVTLESIAAFGYVQQSFGMIPKLRIFMCTVVPLCISQKFFWYSKIRRNGNPVMALPHCGCWGPSQAYCESPSFWSLTCFPLLRLYQ